MVISAQELDVVSNGCSFTSGAGNGNPTVPTGRNWWPMENSAKCENRIVPRYKGGKNPGDLPKHFCVARFCFVTRRKKREIIVHPLETKRDDRKTTRNEDVSLSYKKCSFPLPW